MDDRAPSWFEAFEARLDGRLGGLETRLDGFNARFAALEAKVATLATRDELHKARADIMARIDRLQELITQQQDESSVNYAASDIVKRQVQGLEEQVSHLMRIMFRLRSRLDDLEGKQQGH